MYIVKTEKRIYNSVDSPNQFKVVRDNWGDYTKATEVFKWINPHGWVPVNAYDFQIKGGQQ